MELFAGLSVCLLIASALVISIRIFALWRRSRALPDLLLSVMLVSATVVGYSLAIACHRIPASEMWPIHVAYPLAINLGFACLFFFTLRVFRPGVMWARGLVGVSLLLLAACAVAYIREATSEHPRGPAELTGLSLFNTAPIAVAYFWTTIEALTYYRRLLLQLRLGLSDVHVANRMLLWGLMTLSAGIAVVVNAVAILTGSFMSPLSVSVSSMLGLVHAGCLLLAFQPPGWYRDWVEQRYAAGLA